MPSIDSSQPLTLGCAACVAKLASPVASRTFLGSRGVYFEYFLFRVECELFCVIPHKRIPSKIDQQGLSRLGDGVGDGDGGGR